MRAATHWRRPATGMVLAIVAFASFAQAQPPVSAPPGPEDRVVVTDMVPVPDVGKGAPYYRPTDIDRMRSTTRLNDQRARRDSEQCERNENPKGDISMYTLLEEERQYANDVLLAGSLALRATLAAEDARKIRAGVEVDQQAVVRTELERQVAVIEFDKARLDLINARAAVADYQELARGNAGVARAQLMVRQMKRMNAGWGVNTLANTVSPDAKLENTRALKAKGPKGENWVQVSGLIRNTTNQPLKIPKLTMTILDERGWFLSAVPAETSSRQKIPAQAAIPFQYTLKEIPAAGQNLVVGFASELDPPPRMPMATLKECDKDRNDATSRAFSVDE